MWEHPAPTQFLTTVLLVDQAKSYGETVQPLLKLTETAKSFGLGLVNTNRIDLFVLAVKVIFESVLKVVVEKIGGLAVPPETSQMMELPNWI